MERDYIVTKSNKLISANYNLSLQEQKIILTLASMVQPQDTEFKEYEFKIKDFISLLDIKDEKKYIEVPKITKDLMKKVFEIREEKKIIQLAWLNSVEYELGTGLVRMQFSPKLKPYMLELKELYTSYRLENVLSLKSKYSIRLYEVLKSNSFKKQVTIELEELKNMVGAKEKAYGIYNNLKNRILLKAQGELKEKTDIYFQFEEIKTGRKVTSIKFYIYQNGKAVNEIAAAREEPKEPNNVEETQAIFYKHKITQREAKAILKDSKNNIDLIKQCYEYALSKNKIDNIVGYIRTLVKGFNEPKGNSNAGTFNNFEQRTYNFDELEKKLLGWDKEEE